MALTPGIHGVIGIHGIGDNQKPGEFLAGLANGLADGLLESPWRDESGNLVYPTIERVGDLNADPPAIDLHITAPDGVRASWVCREVFWGDAFVPPPASSV